MFQKTSTIDHFGHRVGFLRVWSVLEKYDFLMIFDWPKVGPKSNKSEKELRGDDRGWSPKSNKLEKELRGDDRGETTEAEPRPRRGEGGM